MSREAALATVEEWRAKSASIRQRSRDDLVPAIDKSIEAMAVVLAEDADQKQIRGALAHLELARTLALENDEMKDDPVRHLTHGLIESLCVTLKALTSQESKPLEMKPRQLPTNVNAASSMSAVLDTSFPTAIFNPVEAKEEEHFPEDDFEPLVDRFDPSTGTSWPSGELDVPSYEQSDEGSEPSVKRRKSGQRKSTWLEASPKKSTPQAAVRQSGTDLKCIECDFATKSVPSWNMHLRRSHKTTPSLAGLLLRCECGTDSYNVRHVCSIYNLTVVRYKEGRIQRLSDKVKSPECVVDQCGVRPTTIRGYIEHLSQHHGATLAKVNSYLQCACGFRVFSANIRKHANCSGAEYAVNPLSELGQDVKSE